MGKREQTIDHLRVEITALESRLDSQNRLIQALKDQLAAHEARTADERRVHIYCRAARDVTDVRLAKPLPVVSENFVQDMSDALNALGERLDHKFAEIRALTEVTEHVNAGMFFSEVLDNVFESFDRIIPYDRIGVALIEEASSGARMVRSQWARAHYEHILLGNNFVAPLASGSLNVLAETRVPRVINDLEQYLREHPRSSSTRLIVREGLRSSLTCPLVARDRVIGFIFFSSLQPDAYHDRHVEIFSQIAGELALTLEKSRAYEELHLRNEFIRKVFGRYVTNEIAEMVLREDGAIALGGDRRKVTILMSDVRNFTTMSEKLAPEKVVDALNTHLGMMTNIIMKYGGSIDNFVGDAIVAVFGVPLVKPDDAARAVACAVEMQNAMAAVNAANGNKELPPLEMGIGLNTGEVVAGNIGSDLRVKYSVIGNPVNIAARLESLASGGQIFASDATFAEIRDIVRTAGHLNVKVKGISGTVPVYEISGIDGPFNVHRAG
jgi:class 3 adenylate cyclase